MSSPQQAEPNLITAWYMVECKQLGLQLKEDDILHSEHGVYVLRLQEVNLRQKFQDQVALDVVRLLEHV